MKKLLEIKHWQLFCILVFIPLIIQISLYIIMWRIGSFPLFFNYTIKFMLPFTILNYAWIWSIGVLLNRKLSADIKMKVGPFKICLLTSLACIIILDFFVGPEFITNPESGLSKVTSFLSVISFACIFYCVYFNAKLLKTVEEYDWIKKGGFIGFNDYRNEFILLLIFPIGIWFIQPRLNSLVRDSDNCNSSIQ